MKSALARIAYPRWLYGHVGLYSKYAARTRTASHLYAAYIIEKSHFGLFTSAMHAEKDVAAGKLGYKLYPHLLDRIYYHIRVSMYGSMYLQQYTYRYR